MGVAAHVTAARPKGPRYDARLTPAERQGHGNAIWLCQFCAALIDRDTHVYTVSLIQGWKRIAEEAARQKLERPAYQPGDGTGRASWFGLRTFPSLADTVRIRGGRRLYGTVTVAGAKNAVSKQLVASLLTAERCVLRDVPPLADVIALCEVILQLGGRVRVGADEESLEIDTGLIRPENLDRLTAFNGRSRLNILLLAPLLHRFGKAIVPEQGGCNLGDRRVDFHLMILEALSAKVKRVGRTLHASAPHGLKGTVVRLPQVSVGATEQALFAGVLARGVTTIKNAALVPEVLDLIKVMDQMGADVEVDSDRRELNVKGAQQLSGFDHHPIPDRSEVGSWASLVLATGGSIEVRNARSNDLVGLWEAFEHAGWRIASSPGGFIFRRGSKVINSVSIQTGSHPAFLTDWQPPFLVAMTQASGTSVIHETVFGGRLGYVPAIKKMGAAVELHTDCLGTVACQFSPGRYEREHQHSAIVSGPATLVGSDVRVDELRGGFACVIAGLVAAGETTIRNFSFLQKGYDSLLHKLLGIGADVTPVGWYPMLR